MDWSLVFGRSVGCLIESGLERSRVSEEVEFYRLDRRTAQKSWCMMAVAQRRTQWAELQAEELLSVPFISEFVFRSPQVIDASQKEVADLLILRKGGGLLVSQKAHEDPESRSESKNGLWALKAARKRANQLLGALRLSTKTIWCEHPRRGRVDFPAGLPPIAHGLVTVETFRPVDLQAAATDLPLSQGSVPVTYISLNDFLNVAVQLRTVPELKRYLDARRALPEATLRRIGEELPIFKLYLLQGTLKQCRGSSACQGGCRGSSGRDQRYMGAIRRVPPIRRAAGACR
jgi:hypothetical protein